MHNTTFTEANPATRRGLCTGIGLFCAFVFAVSQASAQAMEPGCFERIYSDSHLAKTPEQVVWQIRLAVDPERNGGQTARIEVIAANQGHARRDNNHGRVMTTSLYCYVEAGRSRCDVECDGGGFEVTRQNADGITFGTSYLMVGEEQGCGGQMDLAERPNVYVKYRLNRAPAAVCSGM